MSPSPAKTAQLPALWDGRDAAFAERAVAFFEDVTFLLDQGNTPDQVADRLGTTRQTVQQRLRRNGRTDLLTRMYSKRTRRYTK